MADTPFDYGRMIAEALRDVARQALSYTAREGLPGEHHFYLSFRPRAAGVQVPAFLRDQYPDEMTVVLQNQFWDLVVDDDAFAVSLIFGGARQRLVVPFAALTAFADPAAQLGLRFEPPAGGDEAAEPEGDAETDAVDDDGGEATDGGGEASEPASPRRAGAGADVVQLDRFRKKNGEA